MKRAGWDYKGPLPLTANPKRVQENLERDLKERVATSLPKQEVTIMVEPGWGNPEGYLFQMASREHVDLIVVGLTSSAVSAASY
jgi:hypothetical protein